MEQGVRNQRAKISDQKALINNLRPPFGAIFDWDGVIIDSGKLHAQSWRQLATELGRPIAEDSFIRGFGMKSARIIEEIHGWAKEPAEIARLANRKEALYRQIVAQSEIAPLPGVVEWLHRLHEAGVPCAVASSTQRLNIEAVLGRIGLQKAFREIISAEDVVHGKPNPEVFLKAAERLGMAANRAVVFEDAYVGIEAGHAAGMKVVAVATTHSAAELSTADLVVRRLDELTLEQIADVLAFPQDSEASREQ
jgi:beta-phosphoglucomutase family hydrolase